MKEKIKLLTSLVLCFSVFVCSIDYPFSESGLMLRDKYDVARKSEQLRNDDVLEGSYVRYLEHNKDALSGSDYIELNPLQAIRGDGKPVKTGISLNDGTNEIQTLLWDDQAPSYMWAFDVENEGFYNIEFDYLPLELTLDIIYGIKINDEYLFNEAESIKLKNSFVIAGPPEENTYGDQYPIELIQKRIWQKYNAFDIDGIFSLPLKFYLEKGQNTLSMYYKSGAIEISKITISPPDEHISYDEYKEKFDAKNYVGSPILLQAEDADIRSRKSLTSQYSNDPTVTPFVVGKRVQNVLNGWSYRRGNDEITWNIDVPETGLYQLAFRVMQNYYPGRVVYRQILINGEIPFNEAINFAIQGTGQKFQIVTFGDSDSPYSLYLQKGTNTITLRALMGDLSEVYFSLFDVSYTLNKTILDILTITGSTPDPNFNYQLENKAPWVIQQLTQVKEELESNSKILLELGGKTSEMITTINSCVGDIENMLKKPRDITRKMNILNTIQGQIGNWIYTLRDSPLMMDYITVLSPVEEPDNPKVSVIMRLRVFVRNFINSFRKTEVLGNIGAENKDIIEVWTSREREYGEVIQRMANEKFTPASGIEVKVNILGAGSLGVVNTASPLTMALVSGQTPDVVMGSDSVSPVELAIRKSAFDLSVFDDFNYIINRFPEGSLVPFQYEDGVYALPDTIDIPILLYRKDILDSVGISLPQTWDELTAETLPSLNQYNMDFAINATAGTGGGGAIAASGSLLHFMMLYSQNGGTLYTQDKLDSTLDSDLAYMSFRQYTDLYTRYNISFGQNFYNQFNIGRIPLAIGGLYDYLQLDVAAPGIFGKWDIAPVPGVKNESGIIDRSVFGSVTSLMVFDYNQKSEKGWEFIKWWTSEETQVEFSNTIEANIGPEARWYSSNVNAMLSLRWNGDGEKTVKEMLSWYSGVPNILGGYMTSRSVNNAFIRVVINNSQKPRDAIEQAYKEIYEEITRKNIEYGAIK